MNAEEYDFNAWIIKLPAPVQVNILEAAERGESYTRDAWKVAHSLGRRAGLTEAAGICFNDEDGYLTGFQCEQAILKARDA